jgi:hypothetical protein
MTYLYNKLFSSLVTGFLFCLVCSLPVAGQDITNRLTERAGWIPRESSPLDQLVSIAQHYQLPMGIEWAEQTGELKNPLSPELQLTIGELITSVISHVPGTRAVINKSFIWIAQEQIASHPGNFLNLRISDFSLNKETLGRSHALLWIKKKTTLHPGKYSGGWNGGYGEPSEASGTQRKITLSMHNATVRDILNEIIQADGYSAWIVRLVATRKMNGTEFLEQGLLNSGKE